MCSAPSAPKARPVEPAKPAQESMDAASDAAVRAQMLRRGVMSTFSESRGYSAVDGAPAVTPKAETLG